MSGRGQGAKPSSGDLRRGDAYLAPHPGIAKIRRWRPYPNAAGTIRGFVDVEFASGIVILGCMLMRGPAGKHWVAPPSVKQVDTDGTPRLDANGRPRWSPIVEFRDRAAADKFRDLVLEALRRQHPTAFDGDST